MKRDTEKTLYVDDATNSEFLALYMECEAVSESSFMAELLKLGMEIKKRQLAATAQIIERAIQE